MTLDELRAWWIKYSIDVEIAEFDWGRAVGVALFPQTVKYRSTMRPHAVRVLHRWPIRDISRALELGHRRLYQKYRRKIKKWDRKIATPAGVAGV